MLLMVKRINVYWVNKKDPNEICVRIRGAVQDLDTTVSFFINTQSYTSSGH